MLVIVFMYTHRQEHTRGLLEVIVPASEQGLIPIDL